METKRQLPQSLPEYHRQIILEEVFDSSSSVYPLSIIPGDDLGDDIIRYDGVHFVATTCLLSILQPKPSIVEVAFNKYGKRLNSPISLDVAFIFRSVELGVWCDQAVAGLVSPALHCDQPYLYRDEQFASFERIVMQFPAYEVIKKQEPHALDLIYEPSQELKQKLDEELLRFRQCFL